MGEFFLLTPEAPNNNLIMASFRSILEIHVVNRIVPGCGNLAKIDFPLGHFTGIQQFCTGICLNLVPPFFVCVVRGETILQMHSAQFWHLWYPGPCWYSSSVDIAASGLGWFAVGLKGEAVLGVWTYEGVDVVLRNSLIPYRSHTFEVAGFYSLKNRLQG